MRAIFVGVLGGLALLLAWVLEANGHIIYAGHMLTGAVCLFVAAILCGFVED